jgi:predicted DNA-binding protein (UPF0251 family)
MPRPVKWRRVGFIPGVVYFKPAGVPLRVVDEVLLSMEEAEAIRLKDLERLQQEECAQRMKISRPTFHRVLGAARGKLADAIINGKAIRIEGGNYEMTVRRFRCGHDGQEWNVPSDKIVDSYPQVCPTCHGSNVYPVLPPVSGVRGGGRGRGMRRGMRW